jgi:hypothetical protein
MVMFVAPFSTPSGLNVTSRLTKLFSGLPSSSVATPTMISPSYLSVT